MNYSHTIEEVINNFDFDKAHSIMSFLDWKWSIKFEEFRVPTVDEIKTSCRRLLSIAPKHKRAESGGYVALCHDNGTLELQFSPVHCDAFYYDEEIGHHLSFENGHKIVVQHFFKSGDVKVGSSWISSEGLIVKILNVDYEKNELTYIYDGVMRNKDIFAFQCHYCLILEDS